LKEEIDYDPLLILTDDIFNRLTEIKFLKNEIEENTKEKKRKLLERIKLNLNSNSLSATNFSCYSPYTNELTRLGFKEETTETRMATLHSYYNKQCLWLLVESYESFDKYLKKIYEELLLIDNSFELKKKNSKEILNKLRSKIPNFEKIETDNNLGINFQLMIVLYSKIRHLVVHSDGIAEDKNRFIENILKEANIFTKKEYSKQVSEQIDSFFELDTLVLKTIHFKGKNEFGIDTEINTDRLNKLLGRLGSYIFMIHIEVLKYLENGETK
jgi:hypothetical protein